MRGRLQVEITTGFGDRQNYKVLNEPGELKDNEDWGDRSPITGREPPATVGDRLPDRELLPYSWVAASSPVTNVRRSMVADIWRGLAFAGRSIDPPFPALPTRAFLHHQLVQSQLPESHVEVFRHNYVVPLHTPNVIAFLGNKPIPTNPFKIMAVFQPDTHGQKSPPALSMNCPKFAQQEFG